LLPLSRTPAHRDLKPENILYASPAEDAPLKLADFGLATMLKPNQLMTVACGTPGYVAPEILCGTAYGKEVDIWSVGVILYILLCGFPPFYDDNNKKLFSLIINATYTFPDPYWTEVSADAKDLVNKLLVVDPKKRLTAAEILKHPWMVTSSANAANLTHLRDNLKAYNARRRFRSAIRAVQLTTLIKNKKFNGSLVDAVDETEGAITAGAVEVPLAVSS
jgi:serine/threonine protein kinase